MPQTVQLVRGSSSITPNGSSGVTMFTVPSCIACRVITVQLNCMSSVTNTQTYYPMVRHTSSGGYSSPICQGIANNVYTGAISLLTFDDNMGLPSTNGSVYPGGMAAFVGNSATNFTNTSVGAVSQAVGPMPRNFWMGPSDQLTMFLYTSNGGSGTFAYEFILVLYS